LEKKFRDRSLAELSIFYSITAMITFTLAGVLLGLASSVCKARGDDSSMKIFAVLAIVIPVLWIGFLVYLWVGLVRVARLWGENRLGTPIFKYLQIGFFVMTALTMLFRGALFAKFNILMLILIAFDVLILCMIVVFVLLAWSARCKMSRKTYLEITTIVGMILLQFFLAV